MPPTRTSNGALDGRPARHLNARLRASTLDPDVVVIEQGPRVYDDDQADAVYLTSEQRRELGVSIEGFDRGPGRLIYSFPAGYTGAAVDTPLGQLTLYPPRGQRRGSWQFFQVGDDVVLHFERAPERSTYEAGPVPGSLF